MTQPIITWVDERFPCYDHPGLAIPVNTPVWSAWQSLGHHWQKKTSIYLAGPKVSVTIPWPNAGYRTQLGGVAYAIKQEADITHVYRYIAEGLKVWWVVPVCQVPADIAAVKADFPSYLMEALL